ncbi:MAG: transporter substrate-binding domain-containing protein, partial [Candidatus Latescibacteria bacterium]|nr:transporter substrate-binding domain-containing protein [Candidatus Latescibacterota bacterium]
MTHHILPLLFLIVLTVSCGQQDTTPVDIPEAPAPKYTGDLTHLRERGKLRVIVRPDPLAFMPRNAEPVSIDRDIAEGLAASLGLELELVVSDDYSRMIDMLIEGEGDVIAAGLTETETRRERIAFSVPYLFVDEVLVTMESDSMPQTLSDLADYEIAVRRASSNAETASEIKAELPGLRIRELDETLNTEEIVERVSQGVYPATITDSNYWAAVGGYYDNLKTPVIVAKDRPVGLGLRQESTELRIRVDEFLHARFLTRDRDATYKDDLSEIKQRGRLRMITRNNALTYFIHQGREIGFEYQMMHRFAEQQGLRLEIVIPPSHDEVIDYLNDGRGDIVAAAMTITGDREQQAVFSKPYMEVEEVIVVHTADSTVTRPQDLSGKTIHLRASSSFYGSLQRLQQTVPGITIVTLPEDTETEEVLAGVDDGTYDITVSDSNLLQVEQAYGRQLRSAFSVKPAQLGWAVRNNNKELLTALNDFID